MRYISIIAICLCLCINSSAQLEDSVSYYSWVGEYYFYSGSTVNKYYNDCKSDTVLSKTYYSNGNLSSAYLLYFAYYGNKEQEVQQGLVNNGWVNQNRYTITFNSTNQIDSTVTENWNTTWKKQGLETNIYNTKNLLINRYYKFWWSSDWQLSTRLTYTYDNDNNQTLIK